MRHYSVRQVPVRYSGGQQRKGLGVGVVPLPSCVAPLVDAGLLIEAGKFSYARQCANSARSPNRVPTLTAQHTAEEKSQSHRLLRAENSSVPHCTACRHRSVSQRV